jgi:hypothetical protein
VVLRQAKTTNSRLVCVQKKISDTNFGLTLHIADVWEETTTNDNDIDRAEHQNADIELSQG